MSTVLVIATIILAGKPPHNLVAWHNSHSPLSLGVTYSLAGEAGVQALGKGWVQVCSMLSILLGLVVTWGVFFLIVKVRSSQRAEQKYTRPPNTQAQSRHSDMSVHTPQRRPVTWLSLKSMGSRRSGCDYLLNNHSNFHNNRKSPALHN